MAQNLSEAESIPPPTSVSESLRLTSVKSDMSENSPAAKEVSKSFDMLTIEDDEEEVNDCCAHTLIPDQSLTDLTFPIKKETSKMENKKLIVNLEKEENVRVETSEKVETIGTKKIDLKSVNEAATSASTSPFRRTW